MPWDDAIRALDRNDFDLLPFLRALDQNGYQGPIILHTWGLAWDRGHHARSISRYESLRKRLTGLRVVSASPPPACRARRVDSKVSALRAGALNFRQPIGVDPYRLGVAPSEDLEIDVLIALRIFEPPSART
ncbi:MAG: hypothetical protein R3E96_00885 [Planctomycetota bacterium]